MCFILIIKTICVDIHNYKRFTLRCLKTGVILVSYILNNTIRTPIKYDIIKRAQKQFLNECTRSFNNTLSIHGLKRDICYNRLRDVFHRESLQESQLFINRVTKSQQCYNTYYNNNDNNYIGNIFHQCGVIHFTQHHGQMVCKSVFITPHRGTEITLGQKTQFHHSAKVLS